MKKRKDTTISDYLARIGSKGGNARAKNHTKAQLSKWGKLGGRPPKGTKSK